MVHHYALGKLEDVRRRRFGEQPRVSPCTLKKGGPDEQRNTTVRPLKGSQGKLLS